MKILIRIFYCTALSVCLFLSAAMPMDDSTESLISPNVEFSSSQEQTPLEETSDQATEEGAPLEGEETAQGPEEGMGLPESMEQPVEQPMEAYEDYPTQEEPYEQPVYETIEQEPLPLEKTSLPSSAQVEHIKQLSQEPSEEANIFLNFENVSLASVLNYLAEQKKINVLPIKELDDTKVSLTTRTPLTLERAWNILLTLLEINNLSIVKVDNLYRVVSSKDNGQQPLPTYSSATGTEPESLPENDTVIRYVYFFKNIKVSMAKEILSKMIDESGIIDIPDLNACVIKERSLGIKSAMKVVKELDTGGLREAIEVIPLKWASAQTVEQLFKDILGGEAEEKTIRFIGPSSQKEKAYFSSSTKILAEPIKNTLILLGKAKNIDRVKKFIYKYIDVPIGDAESRLHIKEIRYAKAEDLKPLLEDVIKPPRGTAEKAIVAEGGYKVFEDVIISAETADIGEGKTGRAGGNRLIIACNRDDWKRLEELIDKLDKPQPQVALEIMVIAIEASQNKQLGSQHFLLKGKAPGLGINASSAAMEFKNLHSGEGTATGDEDVKKAASYVDLAKKDFLGIDNPTFITLGRATKSGEDRSQTDNIWGIIRSVFNLSNAHVISQPFLVANNYQECTVNIAETRLISGRLEAGTVNLNPKVTKVPKSAKNQITLTPYINSTGNVDLSIDVILEEFQGSGDRINTITRTLTTRSSMATGEVLVLGGLTRSDLRETLYKTPILGDIPILGTLFRSKTKTKAESNLYIFIRPSIIKPRFEGNPDEYTQLKLDYAKYQLIKNDTYAKETDPIQRWFFKPSHQSIKQKLSDARRGIFRPIDDFTYGKQRPISVNMQEDPYFKVSESIAKFKQQREAMRTKKLAHA